MQLRAQRPGVVNVFWDKTPSHKIVGIPFLITIP